MTPSGHEYRSAFTSTTGGVLTDEAGAITGDLELLLRPEADALHVLVRYAGADDWYTVSGGPVRSQRDAESVRSEVVKHLRAPGPVVDGNEKPVSLERFART